MKILIDSYGAVSTLGLDRGLAAIRTAGFDGVDISYYYEAEAMLLGEDYLTAARGLAKQLAALSLPCLQAHAPFAVFYDPEIEKTPAFCGVCRAIESAAILGASRIVVHTVRVPSTAGIDPIAYNLAYYRALLPIAERAGIDIAIENLFYRDECRRPIPALLSRPNLLCDFIGALGCPRAVPCVDLGHAAITGCPPEEFLAGMRGMPPHALHVQDCELIEDSHTIPGLGVLDFGAIAAALFDIGYAGDVDLEVYKYIRAHRAEEVPSALVNAAEAARGFAAMISKGGRA